MTSDEAGAPATSGRGAPDVVLEFPHDEYSPARARRAVRRVVGATDPISFAVELVTSELVANVVMHTDDGGRLAIWHAEPDAALRIEVTDPSGDDPVLEPHPTIDHGRGLWIVSELAVRWGVEHHDHGKTVWAELDHA